MTTSTSISFVRRSVVALIRHESMVTTTNHYCLVTGCHSRVPDAPVGIKRLICRTFVTPQALDEEQKDAVSDQQQQQQQTKQYPNRSNINDFTSIKEVQLENFSPRRLVRYHENYSALEKFVTNWRKEQEEKLAMQQQQEESSSKSASNSSTSSMTKEFLFRTSPIPPYDNLKNFLDRERALIRRDAILHGFDTVEIRVQALQKLGYSVVPSIDRWNHRYGQLVDYLMKRNWRFPYDSEWDTSNKLELDLFNWCRKQRFMYRVLNVAIRGISTTKEAVCYQPTPTRTTASSIDNLVENINNDGQWIKYIMEGNWKLQDTVKCTVNVRLALDRIEKLNKIGFLWNKRTLLWDTMFNRLKEYYDTHGYPVQSHSQQDTRADGSSSTRNSLCLKDPRLSAWVFKQRAEYNLYMKKKGQYTGSMSQYRIDKLNSLNFSWKSQSFNDDNNHNNQHKSSTEIISPVQVQNQVSSKNTNKNDNSQHRPILHQIQQQQQQQQNESNSSKID
jgi:Helicase associated domain